MGYADLHIHTLYSLDGTCSVASVLEYARDHTPLDVVAITDHDQIQGALEAQELGPKYGLEVVPGIEITTSEGHLLALFIQKLIPAGLPLIETLLKVAEQGGIGVAAHPMARGTASLGAGAIYHARRHPEAGQVLLAIEAFNAGIFHHQGNTLARDLAELLRMPQVGGSDAHVLQAVGQAATEFPGHTALDLRHALESGVTQVRRGEVSTPWQMTRAWIPRFLRRKASQVISSL